MKRLLVLILAIGLAPVAGAVGWNPVGVPSQVLEIDFGGRVRESVRLSKTAGPSDTRYVVTLLLDGIPHRQTVIPANLFYALYDRIARHFAAQKRAEAATVYCEKKINTTITSGPATLTDSLCIDRLSRSGMRGFSQWYRAVQVLR